MSQHGFDIANDSSAAVRADINDALKAVATSNSGATAPSPTFPNQWWYDEAEDALKQRNEANTAWLTVRKGFSGHRLVRKDADETVNNSSALQDDDALLIALAANEVVHFELDVIYDSSSGADIKFAFTVPAGASIRWSPEGGLHLDASGAVAAASAVEAGGTALAFGGAGASRTARLEGVVVNGANAGNLQLQWAQNTAEVSDTIVRANSVLRAWRV